MACYGSCGRAPSYFIKYAYVNDVIAQIDNAIYTGLSNYPIRNHRNIGSGSAKGGSEWHDPPPPPSGLLKHSHRHHINTISWSICC